MAKRKKESIPVTHPNWLAPDRSPNFKIGDRVRVSDRSYSALTSGQNGRVYGAIYKIEPIGAGYWYDVHFDGHISHYTIREELLEGI